MGKRKYTEDKTVTSIRLSENEKAIIRKAGFESLQHFIENALKAIDFVVIVSKKDQ